MRRSHIAARVLALTAIAALGSTLLAACGSGSGGQTTVTVGVSGNIFDLSLRLADQQGYFNKQGLSIKYVTLTAATGTSALDSGSVQFINDSPTDFLTGLSKGLQHTAIGTNGLGNPLGLVVSDDFAKKHQLTSNTPPAQVAKALAHSTAGASSTNTKAEAGIFLKANGVDPSALKWVSLPNPTADKAALDRNEIDWFATSEPIPLQLQHSGDGVVVANPTTVPQWSAKQAGYGQLVVAKNSYLKQNPATARKFITAVQQATNYLAKNPDSAATLSAARAVLPGVPDAVLRSSVPQVVWPTSDAMSAAGWQKTLGFINSLDALPTKVTISPGDWTNKYLA